MKSVIIYGLVDPNSDLVYYVGASANPKGRHSQHQKKPVSAGLAKWLAVLEEKGQIPRLVEFCRGSEEESYRLERLVIANLRQAGHPLCNVFNGGDWGHSQRDYYAQVFVNQSDRDFLDQLLLEQGLTKEEATSVAISLLRREYEARGTKVTAREGSDESGRNGQVSWLETPIPGASSGDWKDRDNWREIDTSRNSQGKTQSPPVAPQMPPAYGTPMTPEDMWFTPCGNVERAYVGLANDLDGDSVYLYVDSLADGGEWSNEESVAAKGRRHRVIDVQSGPRRKYTLILHATYYDTEDDAINAALARKITRMIAAG